MGDKKIASIIIPTYNRCQLLKLTLNAILKQTITLNLLEVIIVDDGSSDNTREMLKAYNNKLSLKYFYQEDKGYRVAAARNIGIKNSNGKICIFIDSGIILGSTAIEEHIKVHEMNYNVDCAVIGYVFGFDDDNKDANIIYDLINNDKQDYSIEVLRKHKIFDSREPLYQKHGDDLSSWPAPWIIFWTSNASVKKEVLINIGMFDEYYNTWGGEDTDLALALEKYKVRFVLNRNINSIHYPHEKRYFWAKDNAEGVKDFNRKQKYMY